MLRSAIANAVLVADRNQKRRLDEDDLVVAPATSTRARRMKRVRPAPDGPRATGVLKRTAPHDRRSVAERE